MLYVVGYSLSIIEKRIGFPFFVCMPQTLKEGSFLVQVSVSTCFDELDMPHLY